MNRIISWLLHTEIGRRIEIQMLMNLVTSSLGLQGRNVLGLPSAQSLDIFAAFTSEQLEKSSNEQRQKLHHKAFKLGTMLRRCLIRRDNETLTSMVFLLYSNIGIQMEGHFPEEVMVRCCHFSRHYSPQICSIASLMDSGVIGGLFGGGRLGFSERITEGKLRCRCKMLED